MQKEQFEELLKKAVDTLKEGTLADILANDNHYKSLTQSADEAEDAFMHLNLSADQKQIIENLLDTRDKVNFEYSTLAYMAGMKDSIKILEILSGFN